MIRDSSRDCAMNEQCLRGGGFNPPLSRVVPIQTHKPISINQRPEVLAMPQGAISSSPVTLVGKHLESVKIVPHRLSVVIASYPLA